MFDKYLICEDSLRNVVEDGKTAGFEVQVRLTSYRGLRLALVEGFEVVIDGEAFPREENLFIVGGRRFTFQQMETEYDARWEMGEPAMLRVPKSGGLTLGSHTVTVTEYLRISYMPVISETVDTKQLQVIA